MSTQPQLSGLLRLDIVEQLPLPVPSQPTHASIVQTAPHAAQLSPPLPPSQQQLEELLSQPDVLQGVQQALMAARMQQRHIVPRLEHAQPSAERDPILSCLLQGHPDLLSQPAPAAAASTRGSNTPCMPASQPETQGLDDHLLSYTDPAVVAVQNNKTPKPEEAPATTTQLRSSKRKRTKRKFSDEGEQELEQQQQQQQQQQEQEQQVYVEQGGGYEAPEASSPEDAAGRLSTFLSSLVGSLPAPVAENGSAHASKKGDLKPAQLQALGGQLLAARSGGYLSKVPAGVLKSTLQALHPTISAGASLVVPDGKESAELRLVLEALSAASCASYILSTSDLPPDVYMEEVVQSVISLVQHTTQVNVLATVDEQCRRLWRPNEPPESTDAAASTKKGARTPKTPRAGSKAAQQRSGHLGDLLPALEQVLVLLTDVLGAVKVDASHILPLVRIMLTCMSVDALQPVFHVKASGLVVAVFRTLPEQRPVMLLEMLSSTGLLGASPSATGSSSSSKGPPREFLVQDEPPVQIQVSTALILQLIQATAKLPPIEEADLGAIQDSCKVPVMWCDRLWVMLLEKLPAAKSHSLDIKAFLEHFTQDLLAAQHVLEWPAAQLLLRRLVMALNTSKGLQHPESSVRLACIDLLGVITSAFLADCKQAEEEQDTVDSMLAASGYDADAMKEGGPFLGDEDKARVEALQKLLIGALAARPFTCTCQSARTFIVMQMLQARAAFEQQQPPVMSSQPEPAPEPAQRPAKKKGRKSAAAAAAAAAEEEKEELRRQAEAAAAPQGSATLAEFHALHSAPPRVAASGADAPSTAAISRWLLLNSQIGKGRGSILLWLVNAGNAMTGDTKRAAGASYQAISTAERSCAMKALGGAIEKDERVLGHADVQTAVCAALSDDAVSVREAAVDLLGRHISHNSELAMYYFDLIGQASSDSGLSVRKRAVKVLWDCCMHCSSAPPEPLIDGSATPGFTRACEAVSLIMARAADPEDSMRKLATGLCAGLLFLPGGRGTDEGLQGTQPRAAGVAAAAQGSQSARAMLLAEVCDLAYRSDAPSSIKLPLAPDSSLVVVLKAILGQSSASQPIVATDKATVAHAAAARDGASKLARALLSKIMELQETAAAASAALDAANTGSSQTVAPPTPSHGTAGTAGAARSAPDAGSPQHNNGTHKGAAEGASHAHTSALAGAAECASGVHAHPQQQQQQQQEQLNLQEGGGTSVVGGSNVAGAAQAGVPRSHAFAASAAAAEAALEAAEEQQLQCLLALHALCTADVGVLAQASGGASYFVRGVAPYFKELVTVGDKSSILSKRVRSERLMCAMHIVASLACRAEGVRLEAVLIKDLVSDLQQIIGRHLYVSVVSSAVQCMCALSHAHPSLVTQQIVGLASRYYQMLESDLNGGQTETSMYRGMYPKLLFILGNFCRYAAHVLDQHAGTQVEVPSASTTSGGPVQAVSIRSCLALFLDFFAQGTSLHPGGVTPKVTEAALQAMGLLFTARPELMWDVKGCLALLEEQLQPTASLAHKARVLQNLIDLLKAEEEGLVVRQKKVEEEYLAQPSFGTLTTPASTADTAAAASFKAVSHGTAASSVGGAQRGRGGRSASKSRRGAQASAVPDATPAELQGVQVHGADGTSTAGNGDGSLGGMPGGGIGGSGHGSVLAQRNGEGDVSSISSDVVRKLWPSVLQAATDTGIQAQQGAASPAALHEAMKNAATVRRRVLELVEVAHRGGLTAPWDAISALVALSTDPAPDISSRALHVLKQCCEHHAPLVPSKLAGGITDTYRFQMALAKVSASAASGDSSPSSGKPRKPPRPPTPKELLGRGPLPVALGNLWASVVATDRTRKAKFLSALLKPFEEASCLAVQGTAGAPKGADMHLLAFCCATAAELPYRKGDEPLTLLTTINSIVTRRGHAALTALKQACSAPIPVNGDDHHHHHHQQQQQQQQQGAEQGGVLQDEGEEAHRHYDQHHQEKQPSALSSEPTAVPYSVAAKASLAVCMLLLLKKFLREAYRLADDRVAAYAANQVASRKVEEKAGVSRDMRIRLMLYDDVLDLGAPEQTADSKAARELYKTIKYLINEDAANYRPPPSLDGDVDEAAGADTATAGAKADVVGAAAKPKGKAAAPKRKAQPKAQPQRAKRKKRSLTHVDSEDDEEGDGGDSDDADFAPPAKSRRTRGQQQAGAGARGGKPASEAFKLKDLWLLSQRSACVFS